MHMIIEPKIRGFICTTAHPEGCAENVHRQIKYVTSYAPITSGPKKVLVIGSSTGYGLASRIVATFGCNAQTIGISFERPSQGKRTASPGWYNISAFQKAAHLSGIYAKSINGDAFANATKQVTLNLIKQDWKGGIDLVIYSLASSRRIHPYAGRSFTSVLKPIGTAYTNKTIDIMSGCLSSISIEPATAQEINDTVSVMGGEDWIMWIEALLKESLLAKSVKTVAYSYIGPQLTEPIYTKGTIGVAKKNLLAASKILTKRLLSINGQALISINKALVTQASAAIPVVPLYISILYKIMKEKNLHEGCIEQIYRLYQDRLYTKEGSIVVDGEGLVRIDDWEMQKDVQKSVSELWSKVNNSNVLTLTDFLGYQNEFYNLFGFKLDKVDYNLPQVIDVAIPSLSLVQ